MTDKECLKFMDWIRRPEGIQSAAPRLRVASIQAGDFVYSTPRANDCDWYTEVEIGFPSVKPSKDIMQYQEDSTRHWRDSVFCFVPVELVFDWIERYGGWENMKP